MENTQGSEAFAGQSSLPVPRTESGIANKAIPPWEIRFSRTRGIPYFFNPETNKSEWLAPDTLSDEEIKQLPGAEYLSKEPQQVQASHLLVKHQGSRRPSSWKESNITRTKKEAIAMLREYQARLKLDGSKDTFAKLANEHSDCSSHEKGGNLGLFARGTMQKPFEDAAFALQVGEVSEVISTDSGVHLILRTG